MIYAYGITILFFGMLMYILGYMKGHSDNIDEDEINHKVWGRNNE